MSVPPRMKKQRIDVKLYMELLDARKFDQLINYLDSIKDDNENNWNYHHQYGFVFRIMGKYDDALIYYHKALNIFNAINKQWDEGLDDSKTNKEDLTMINHNLGIAYQLNEDFVNSVKYLNESIEADEYNISSYSSLGLTYRKMEKYVDAQSVYLQGKDKLFGNILKKIENKPIGKNSEIINYSFDEDQIWVETSTRALMELSRLDKIESVYMPGGQVAKNYYQEKNDAGILFKDAEENDKKVRWVLPSYFDYMYLSLKSDLIYTSLLNNLGVINLLLGERDEAKAIFKESIEFIPHGVDYKDPYINLDYSNNS